MPPKTHLYKNLVDRIAKKFDGYLSEMEAIYNFDNGDEFEIAICKTLRRFLPQKYGVCQGFVVDKSGNPAGDDIIIYEQIHYPTFRQIGGDDFAQKEQIPIEAVYAYIEAKHTLHLEGAEDDGSTIKHAAHQAEIVKELCLQRNPVPLNQIRRNLSLTGTRFINKPGWPDRLDPIYTAIFSKHISIKKGDDPITDGNNVHDLLQEKELPINPLLAPDLILLGSSNVLAPYFEMEDHNRILMPYSIPGNNLVCLTGTNLARGAALAHLLWALDFIELGLMPWPEIFHESFDW